MWLPDLASALPREYLRTRRWFASKSKHIASLAALDHVALLDEPLVLEVLVEVRFTDGSSERYQVPLLCERAADTPRPARGTPIMELPSESGNLRLYDAFVEPHIGARLLELLRANRALHGRRGTFAFSAVAPDLDPADGRDTRLLGVEQSNTSLVLRDRWIMKILRKLEPGRSRDFEVGRFLSTQARFRHSPAVGGTIEYRQAGDQTTTLAVLLAYVPNRGDGWSYVLERLVAALRSTLPAAERTGAVPGSAFRVPRAGARKAKPGILDDDLRELGRVTGELHRALASGPSPTFSPEPASPRDLAGWADDLRRQAALAFRAAADSLASAPPSPRGLLRRFLAEEPRHRRALDRLLAGLDSLRLAKIQVHGDYHLGQVLKTDDSFLVIDFEGEPARPLAERWAKQSPLRDVAGMLRSFSYAAHVAARAFPDPQRERLLPRALAWERAASEVFLEAYSGALAGSGLLPGPPASLVELARLFQLAKAYYEVRYELNNRPEWVEVPLLGLERLLAPSG